MCWIWKKNVQETNWMWENFVGYVLNLWKLCNICTEYEKMCKRCTECKKILWEMCWMSEYFLRNVENVIKL